MYNYLYKTFKKLYNKYKFKFYVNYLLLKNYFVVHFNEYRTYISK